MKQSVRRKRKSNKAGAGPQSIFMYDTLGVAMVGISRRRPAEFPLQQIQRNSKGSRI